MKITQSVEREIIEDFAKEIVKRRTRTAKPSKTVIDFRSWKRDGVEREIFNVPLDLLRYRKDNGRIASNVLSYERGSGHLRETDQESQKKLAEFLEEKDPDKTIELQNLIYAGGQDTPAIVTCDGFLIDGNRRRLVLDKLQTQYPQRPDFEMMKVVFLPGPDEEGGPPTLLEIEKIENRLQLQSDGKADYYGFDAALSIRQKEQRGFPLEEQLRDDPQYMSLDERSFQREVKKKRQDLLAPLECIDRYLSQFARPGMYNSISKGLGDRDGRWQAFLDYSNTYHRVLENPKKRLEFGIDENEVGDIEDAAFKIIRLRDLAGVTKVHTVMRNFPKYCKHAKKEILAISNKVRDDISDKEKYTPTGEPKSIEEQDKLWAASEQQTIIYNIKKAETIRNRETEKETPIELLKAALNKLKHEQMNISNISINDYKVARDLAADIQRTAKEIEGSIYQAHKDLKKLTSKK